MLSWHFVTSTEYLAADTATKTSDKLYFLSDTSEIYRGTQPFTEAVVLYTTEPEVKAVGKIYVNTTTLEGKVWNGTAWTTVIQPVQSTLTATDTAKPVSGKAVADYVTSAISAVTGSSDLVKDVSYTSTSNVLTVTFSDDSTDTITLSNVAANLTYNPTTGDLQVVNAAGTAIGTAINLDLERFVTSSSFDAESGVITLSFNDDSDPLTIDVSSLVDTYTAANSASVNLSVSGNVFTATANISTDAGNTLTSTSTGLYVAATDISGKADLVSGGTTGNIVVLTSTGGIDDSGLTAGGATLASTTNSTTLATEAAVSAAVSALSSSVTTSLDTKMTKVASTDAGEVIIASSTGDASASGYTLGGAAFATTTLSTTIATEKGVTEYVTTNSVAQANIVASADLATSTTTASEDKVVSEAALVASMTWQTTV